MPFVHHDPVRVPTAVQQPPTWLIDEDSTPVPGHRPTVMAPAAMGEHRCGMQAAMTLRFADSGGASGCANAQGSNFEPHPAV